MLTAQMFSLPRDTIIVTAQAGLPALARLTEVNPLLLARLHASSRRPVPESLDRFYIRLAESPFVLQTLLDDHRATYGGMLDPVNRVAAQQAGITEGQAREVLAALLPAINTLLGKPGADDETDYARRLQDLGA